MRFFKKRDKVEEEKEVELRELETLIANKIKEEGDEVVRRGRIILDNIRATTDIINTIVKEMNAVKIDKDEVATQYISAMKNAKHNLLSVISNINKSKLSLNSIEDLDDTKKQISSMLSKLGEVTKSHRRVIYELFPSYAKRLKAELERLKEYSEELDSLISNYEKKINILEGSKAKILEIIRAEKELAITREDKKNREDSIIALNKKLELITSELDNTKQDKEYLKQKELLNKIRAEYQQTLDNISKSLSSISRAINKYDYTLGIEKDKKKLLTSVIKKPSNIINIDVNILSLLFNDIIKAIKENKIQLKNPEKDISTLEELNSKLSSYVRLIKEYEGKITEIRNITKPLDSKLERLEESFRSINDEIEQLNKKKSDYTNKIKELEDLIENNTHTIKNELEKIMLKIKVKYFRC